MRALGWITVARRLLPATWLRRTGTRSAPAKRNTRPAVETLESIDLLSRAGLGFPAFRPVMAPALTSTITPTTTQAKGISALTSTQSTAAQSAVVPQTLTNFNLPFAPDLDLFDTSLGELISVKLTANASLTS
ncbi:MAG: hypothetical protein AB7I30_09470, partial [Isosphaeraceae bacterium]